MREFCITTATSVLSATQTLIYMRAAAAPSMNIEVLRWWIGQTTNATSAQQRIGIYQRGTQFPTLQAYTPVVLKTQDPNACVLVGSTTGAAGTAGVAASAEGAGATYVKTLEDAFNVLNGWLQVPTPPETMITPAGSSTGLALMLTTTPSATAAWSWGCNLREV